MATTQQVQEDIQKMLDQYDGDKNGVITLNEAVDYFKKSGSKYPERSASLVFRALDTNKDGSIDYNEIKADVITKIEYKLQEDIEADVQAFLLRYDSNKDEKIEFNEMVRHLEELGSPNAKKNAEWIFGEIDTDKDKVITYAEIEEYSRKSRTLNPSQ